MRFKSLSVHFLPEKECVPVKRFGYFDFLGQNCVIKDISLRMSCRSPKSAKSASRNTNVRVIDVPVYRIGDNLFRVVPESRLLRQLTEGKEIGLIIKGISGGNRQTSTAFSFEYCLIKFHAATVRWNVSRSQG